MWKTGFIIWSQREIHRPDSQEKVYFVLLNQLTTHTGEDSK